MTIAGAIEAIENAAEPASAQALFRARQHRLDELVDAVEILVMNESAQTPRPLLEEAVTAISDAVGKTPVWMRTDIAPVSLLDHLFVAEGQLRKRHYRAMVLDLEDSDVTG